MMQMIPAYNEFLNRKDSPTNYYDPSLIEELTACKDMEMEQMRPFSEYEEDYFDLGSSSTVTKSMKPMVFANVVLHDCKLSGCDKDCKEKHRNEDIDSDEDCSSIVSPNDLYFVCAEPYTPDNDHSYYASASKQIVQTPNPMSDFDYKLDVLQNIPTPPPTESPTETSSGLMKHSFDIRLTFFCPLRQLYVIEDEVDVVTVPEEYQPRVVQKCDYLPRRSGRTPKFIQKPQRTPKQKIRLTAKSLKAAMKRTNIQSAHRTKRRKVNNSLETTPSSSVASSAQNSRCNSDSENPNTEKSKKKSKSKNSDHNKSEQNRRKVQKDALHDLRVCIPDLQMNPKAPKVLILNTATSLIQKLEQNSLVLEEIKCRELKKRDELRAKLYNLHMRLRLKR